MTIKDCLRLAWDFCDDEHGFFSTIADADAGGCRCASLARQFLRVYERGKLARVA